MLCPPAQCGSIYPPLGPRCVRLPVSPLGGLGRHVVIPQLQGSWALGASVATPGAGAPTALLCRLPQADVCGRHARQDHPVPEEDQDGESPGSDRRGGWGLRAGPWLGSYPSLRLDVTPGPSWPTAAGGPDQMESVFKVKPWPPAVSMVPESLSAALLQPAVS